MSVTVIKQITRGVEFAGDVKDSYFAAAYNNNYFEWTGTGARQASLTFGLEWVEGYTPSYPIDGDSFEFILAGVTYTFTFKTSPDSSGYQLPLRGGGDSYVTYCTNIYNLQKLAPCFGSDFTLTLDTTPGANIYKVVIESLNYKTISLGSGSLHSPLVAGGSLAVSPISIIDAEITFNGSLAFTNLISPTGTFKFNCIEAIKSLFGYFEDTTVYEYADVVVFEPNLSKKVTVGLKVNYSDETSDTTSVTAYFVPAVRQHTDKLKTSMYLYESDYLLATPGTGSELARALMPTGINKDQFTQRLKIFKGYPQDISIITKPTHNNLQFALFPVTGSSLGFENRTIAVSSGLRTDKWVQRVILSDGVDTLDLLTTFPQQKGRMQISSSVDADTGPSSIFTFSYELVDDCGTYLKWRNAEGGWSYWLFSKNTRNQIDTKTKGVVNINDGDLSYQADETNIGVDSAEKIQITAQNLDKIDLDTLLSLSVSPCVYLYMDPKGTLLNENSWLKLPQISNFKYTRKSDSKLFNVGFEFSLPKLFTQTL